MILLYSDNSHIDKYWMSEFNFAQSVSISHSIKEFENTSATLKVSFTACRYNCEFDQETFNTEEDRIGYLSQISDLVFVIDYNFYTDQYYPLWDKLPQKNIYWAVPGILNTDESVKSNIVTWPGWFHGVTGVYRSIPALLEQFNTSLPKPLYFDALLGRPREHRDYVFDAINRSTHKDKIVTTYLRSHDQMQEFLSNEFVWDRDCTVDGSLNGMQDLVMYHGHLVGLYAIVPIDLYNQTAYSIIAETNTDNRITFFTEKIAKPILGRRLFIVFTGWKFLEGLRSLGFKTFSSIIDESYDLIENNEKRYAAAFAQVERLCTLDQQEVYDAIKDILDYNYNLLTQTNWDTELSKSMLKIINDYSTL